MPFSPATLEAALAALAERRRPPGLAELLREISQWPDHGVAAFIQRLLDFPPEGAAPAADWIEQVLAAIARREPGNRDSLAEPVDLVGLAERLYRRLHPSSVGRGFLLQWLATMETPAAHEHFTAAMIDDPPRSPQAVLAACAPLFRRPARGAACFPKLLEALTHASVADVVLDLANHLMRTGAVTRHPAADSADRLIELTRTAAERMALLEEGGGAAAATVGALVERIDQGVALLVALSDALAWIGDRRALPSLRAVARLKHRRLRTEAAAALIRLGESAEIETLLGLAAEPMARRRVLAYAEELGLAGRVDPRWTTDVAHAEAELAVWLADPMRFGIAPQVLTLVDRRELSWPGYDEPRVCWLFRFEYRLPHRTVANLGIVGPCTHAVHPSLEGWPLEDVYALFAGCHAAHEALCELDPAALRPGVRARLEPRRSRLTAAGFELGETAFAGRIFESEYLVGLARRDGREGTWVVGDEGSFWIPHPPGADFPIELAYAIFKGRRLLAAFNDDFAAEPGQIES